MIPLMLLYFLKPFSLLGAWPAIIPSVIHPLYGHFFIIDTYPPACIIFQPAPLSLLLASWGSPVLFCPSLPPLSVYFQDPKDEKKNTHSFTLQAMLFYLVPSKYFIELFSYIYHAMFGMLWSRAAQG